MSYSQSMKAFLMTVLWLLINSPSQAAREYTEFYHTDASGSMVAASDEQGKLIWKKTYDPYGNEVITTENGEEYEGQAYTGKPYDKETGLLYLGQRYYDPEIKRFISMDPVGFVPSNPTSFNRYAYANNNPYRFVDPDGRSAVTAFGGLLNESYNFARGHGFDGTMVMGALVDGYNGEGSGLGWALFEDITSFVPLGSSVKGYRFLKGHYDNVPTPLTMVNVAPKGPRVFKNLAPGEEIGQALLFPISRIKAGFSGRRNFVVLESGELIIGKSGHLSLSQGANVLSAGEAKFVNGALKSLNNASGHFKPFGVNAKNAAESAFGKAGFDSIGKFIEKTF